LKKDIVRKTFLKKRQELSSSLFEELSSQVIQNTIELIKQLKPQCIHCFLPISTKGEINTMPIIQYCWDNQINVAVPVSNFEDGTLKNAELRPNTGLKKTQHNIAEPIDPIWMNNSAIDLVITPLLAFDIRGYRVGYGKGFYDRFFDSLRQEPKKIGLSLFDPCKAIEDIADHDMPLTHCVTPQKIYIF